MKHPTIEVMTVCFATIFGVIGCTSIGESEQAEVHGTATYRERIMLPPGATLEVTVEDVSRADAPATILGRATVTSPGAPPIPFTVTYAAGKFSPLGRYAVRARVIADNRLIFTTDTFHALPAPGNNTPLSLTMVSVRSGPATADLVNTLWKLLQLGETPVKVTGQQREPSLVLREPVDGVRRVTGYSGCNSMFGSYTLQGSQLAFTQMGGTKMACAEGMETESAFHAALTRVTRWAIRGEQLELFDAEGNRVGLLGSVPE